MCENAVDGDGNDEASKKSGNVKIGGVAVNAKKLLEVEAMLRPLGKMMPFWCFFICLRTCIYLFPSIFTCLRLTCPE